MKREPSKERAKWQQRVAAWEISGKAAKHWCLQHNVPYVSFITWRKRLQSEPKAPSSQVSTDFVELTESPSTRSGIQISFRNLTCSLSKDFDEVALIRFLRSLEKI